MDRSFGRMSCWETKLSFNHEFTVKNSVLRYKEKIICKGKDSKLAVTRIWDTKVEVQGPVNTLGFLLPPNPNLERS